MMNNYNNMAQDWIPYIRESVDKVVEINNKIDELSNTASTDGDKDKLTKLYFEQMLRGLYLNYYQNPYPY